MTDLRKAAEMALEFIVLSSSKDRAWFTEKEFEVVAALRQALAQPGQKGYCTCGNPEALEMVHFRTRPCIHYTEPPSLEAAVSAEREACAKVCDKEQEFIASGGPYVFSARRCATNIRARGDK